MKIGDEVYVHGYVDEIREDCIIIRNEYGYFGTSEDEIYIKADHKDEPQTDCETCRYAGGCDWEPWQECPYTPKNEPQTDEFQTSNEQVLEMALNNCKFKHNGCNNCTRDCMWRE